MFNKDKPSTPVTSRPAAPEAMTTSAAPRRPMGRGASGPSILSGDIVIAGTVTSEGEIQLDGVVDGDVRAGALIIGEKAAVKGDVLAESVVVKGRVVGSVRGRHVQLASTARIEGDITHSQLSVESGAFFEGHCRHAADPMNAGTEPAVVTASKPRMPAAEAPAAPVAPVVARPSYLPPVGAAAPAAVMTAPAASARADDGES